MNVAKCTMSNAFSFYFLKKSKQALASSSAITEIKVTILTLSTER